MTWNAAGGWMESRDMTESGLGAIPTGTLLGNKSPRTLDRMWAQDLLCSCSMHEVRIDKRERSGRSTYRADPGQWQPKEL